MPIEGAIHLRSHNIPLMLWHHNMHDAMRSLSLQLQLRSMPVSPSQIFPMVEKLNGGFTYTENSLVKLGNDTFYCALCILLCIYSIEDGTKQAKKQDLAHTFQHTSREQPLHNGFLLQVWLQNKNIFDGTQLLDSLYFENFSPSPFPNVNKKSKPCKCDTILSIEAKVGIFQILSY